MTVGVEDDVERLTVLAVAVTGHGSAGRGVSIVSAETLPAREGHDIVTTR